MDFKWLILLPLTDVALKNWNDSMEAQMLAFVEAVCGKTKLKSKTLQ